MCVCVCMSVRAHVCACLFNVYHLMSRISGHHRSKHLYSMCFLLIMKCGGLGGPWVHNSVHMCFIEFYVQSFCNKQLVEISEMCFIYFIDGIFNRREGENIERLRLRVLQIREEEEEV